MIRSIKTKRSHRIDRQTGEYFRSLAERIRGMRTSGVGVAQTLGVTSCYPGEGVSTVALNLAVAAAGVYHGPVLAVETDWQQSTFAKCFDVEEGPGLADRGNVQQALSRGSSDVRTGSPVAAVS